MQQPLIRWKGNPLLGWLGAISMTSRVTITSTELIEDVGWESRRPRFPGLSLNVVSGACSSIRPLPLHHKGQAALTTKTEAPQRRWRNGKKPTWPTLTSLALEMGAVCGKKKKPRFDPWLVQAENANVYLWLHKRGFNHQPTIVALQSAQLTTLHDGGSWAPPTPPSPSPKPLRNPPRTPSHP